MATIRERLQAAIQVYRYGYPAARSIGATKAAPFVIWPEFWRTAPQWKTIDLTSYIEEGFSANTLIYSAIMYKARSSAQVVLRAYKGTQDEPELLPENHPLAQLVARPNQSQSWREFQMTQDIWLNLAGEAWTWFERRGAVNGVPRAAYPLNPLRVYILPGEKGRVKGYLYVPEGKAIQDGYPLLPQDVSHVKLPNPGDGLDGEGYGLSPLSPLAKSADVDNMITSFLAIFFQHGAIPAGLLKYDVPLEDRIVGQIKERWQAMYGGYDKWSEVGVLDRGGSYERLGMNFDELGFDSLDERNESRILGPFGVPPILIGSRLGLLRSTYANYAEARTAFWEDTMTGELGLFEDDYRYYIQSDDGGFVMFDMSNVPALRKDIPALVQAWRGLVEYGVPKYQAASIVGLELGDLPDGNTSYMPLTLMPINGGEQSTGGGSEELPNAEEEEEPAPKYMLDLAMELKRANDLLEETK